MPKYDEVREAYLAGPSPHKLEIGAGTSSRAGWLATDLHGRENTDGSVVLPFDATMEFPLETNKFDFIYSEHMIEHIDFDGGQNMLTECHRVLKPGGILRIVTPSVEFLSKVISADRSPLEANYRDWSVKKFVPYASETTNAFFLNNFMRAWSHTFIYDADTMELALSSAGFDNIRECEITTSSHPDLCGLEFEARLPSGFLRLESMVFEAIKGPLKRTDFASTNIALGKRATQSSISPWSRENTPEGDASGVVSGNITGKYNCHTALETRPWWRVDLEQMSSIHLIKIYNRHGVRAVMDRTSRFEIQVSADDNTWQCVFRKDNGLLVGGGPQAPFSWVPEKPVMARFVRIQLIGREFLNLDQVQIYGRLEPAAVFVYDEGRFWADNRK